MELRQKISWVTVKVISPRNRTQISGKKAMNLIFCKSYKKTVDFFLNCVTPGHMTIIGGVVDKRFMIFMYRRVNEIFHNIFLDCKFLWSSCHNRQYNFEFKGFVCLEYVAQCPNRGRFEVL